jgi:hypothetical protein
MFLRTRQGNGEKGNEDRAEQNADTVGKSAELPLIPQGRLRGVLCIQSES